MGASFSDPARSFAVEFDEDRFRHVRKMLDEAERLVREASSYVRGASQALGRIIGDPHGFMDVGSCESWPEWFDMERFDPEKVERRLVKICEEWRLPVERLSDGRATFCAQAFGILFHRLGRDRDMLWEMRRRDAHL